MEELIGHATAIGQVTRESGNILGNSLKTIYSRITTMSGSIEMLKNAGVEVYDSMGQLRGVGDILDELGGKWAGLNSETQQMLSLQLAGRFQLSRFLTMMQQHEEAVKATETAYNSQNSAIKENERFLDSHQAKINKMQNAITEAYVQVGQAFADDAIVAFVTTVTDAIKAVSSLVDKIGALPLILGAMTPVMLLVNRSFSNYIANGIEAVRTADLFANSTRKITKENYSTIKSNRDLQVSQQNLNVSTSQGTVTLQQSSGAKRKATIQHVNLTTATQNLDFAKKRLRATTFSLIPAINTSTASIRAKTIGVKALTASLRFATVALRTLLSSTIIGAGFVVLGIALEKLIGHFTQVREEARKFNEETKKNLSTFSENSTEIKNLTKEYIELKNKTKLTYDEKTRLQEISNQLNSTLPILTDHVDENGNAHLRSSEAIALEVAHLERLRKLENQTTIASFDNDIDSSQEEYDKKVKELEKINVKLENNKKNIVDVNEAERERIKLQRELESVQHEINLMDTEGSQLAIKNAEARLELNEVTQELTSQDKMLISQFEESNRTMIESIENEEERKQSLYDLSDAIVDYGEKLATVRKIVGEDFDVKIFDDLGVDISKLNDKKLKEIASMMHIISTLVKRGETDFNDLHDAIKRLGLDPEKAIQSVKDSLDDLRKASEGGILFLDPEGNNRVATENLNQLLEEGTQLYIEINGEIIEYAEGMDLATGAVNGHILSIQNLMDEYDRQSDSISIYNKLLEDMADGKQLSGREALELMSKEEDLTKAITVENGVVKVNTDKVLEMRDAKIKTYKDTLVSAKESLQKELKAIQDSLNKKIQFMNIELTGYKTLAEARNGLTTAWNNTVKEKGWTDNWATQGAGAWAEEQLTDIAPLLKGMSELDVLLADVDTSLSTVGTSTDKNTDSNKKNSDSTKDQTYVTDEYKNSLEKLRHELQNIQREKSKYIRGSKEWMKQSEKENEKIKEQIELHKEQAKSLKNQISTGNFIQTGMIDSSKLSSNTSTSSSLNSKLGGKLSGLGDLFIKYGTQSGVSPELLSAIAIHETGNGTSSAIKNKNNAFGIMGKNGLRSFESVEESIKYTADLLARNYINKGLDSIAKIGAKYAPVGAGNDPNGLNNHWVKNVTKFFNELSGGISTVSNESDKVSQKLQGWDKKVTSKYGMRKHPVYGDMRMHHGVDIGFAQGSKLQSNVSGTVKSAGFTSGGYGGLIEITDGQGKVHRYAHMNAINVSAGDTIGVGDVIGKTGGTKGTKGAGTSTGAHLHYEVRVNGKSIDPADFINQAKNMQVSSSNTQATISQLADQANSEILSIESTIKELEESIIDFFEKADARSYYLNSLREGADRSIQRSQQIMGVTSEGSSPYRDEILKQNKQIKYKQSLLHSEANEWRGVIKELEKYADANGLVLESLDQYKHAQVEISKLGMEWWELDSAIKENNKSLSESFAIEHYNKKMDELDYNLSLAKESMGLLNEESEEYTDNIVKQNDLLIDKIHTTEDEIDRQQTLLSIQKKGTKAYEETEEKLRDLILAVLGYKKELKSLQETTKQVAQNKINTISSTESKIVEMIRHRINEEKRLLQESLSDYEEYINNKINILQKEYDEENYQKNLQKEQDELLKLRKSLDEQMLDDSLDSRNKQRSLREQIVNQEEKIEEIVRKKGLDLQVEHLNDLVKKEREKTEKNLKELDRQLENDKLYAEARKAIETGHLKWLIRESDNTYKKIKGIVQFDMLEIEKAYVEFENRYGIGMSILGEKTKNEFIAQIKTAQTEIKNLAKLIEEIGLVDFELNIPENEGVGDLSSDNLNLLWAKFVNDKVMQDSKVKSNKIATKSFGSMRDTIVEHFIRDRSSTLDPNNEKNFDGIYNDLPIQQKLQLAEFLKESLLSGRVSDPTNIKVIEDILKGLPRFDTGGYTGDFKGEKLAFLHKKEQILNENDTANLFEAVKVSNNFMENFKKSLPKLSIPNIMQKFGNHNKDKSEGMTFNFDNLININGNADSNTVNDIQRAGNEVIEKLNRTFSKMGVLRRV